MVARDHYVGIDVCKDWLDVFWLSDGTAFRLPNTADGHNELMCRLSGCESRIGFEATGGHEWALWDVLSKAGFEARQLPPAQIKFFAASRGTRAKTDRIDAEMIARFMAFRPEAGRVIPPDKLRDLRALTTKRAQLVEMRKRHLCQINARRRAKVMEDVDALDRNLLELLGDQITEVESRIKTNLKTDDAVRSRAGNLRSIPGVGPVLTAILIAGMPELGTICDKQIAALAGLAPIARDSGSMRGKRSIGGGRGQVRHVLFQAALVAAQHNPVLRSFAKRLRERGKPHKVIITAVARKLLTIANAIAKRNTPWMNKWAD